MHDENAGDPTNKSLEDNERNDSVENSELEGPGGKIGPMSHPGEKLRRDIANIKLPVVPNFKLPQYKPPSFKLPESPLKGITGVSWLAEQQAVAMRKLVKPALDAQAFWDKHIAMMKPMLDAQERWQKQFADIRLPNINSELFKTPPINVDFNAFTAAARIAEQQTNWLKNLNAAIAAMRADFYPPNLRAIVGLELEEVDQVVMEDGIPLYGVPRTEIAERLVRAENMSERREIIGRRWKAISVDCRTAVGSCTSEAVLPYVGFATAALEALDSDHTACAQAMAGSLVDTIVNGYFGKQRYKYTPNKQTTTNDAYNEFTIREFIAFAPIWRTYQQFLAANGDKIPTTFSRHATAHAVSTRQYSKRNTVQGLMLVCSLLFRLDEEAQAVESKTK